jgi:hypothetical protein
MNQRYERTSRCESITGGERIIYPAAVLHKGSGGEVLGRELEGLQLGGPLFATEGGGGGPAVHISYTSVTSCVVHISLKNYITSQSYTPDP